MKRLRARLDSLSLPAWAFPIVLLGLVVLSYGLLANRLGLYWDDWSKTLVNRLYGLSGYWGYYAEDRPLSGWTHIFFLSLFGDKPLYWHLLTLALRWGTAVSIWLALKWLWPASPMRAAFTSALFAVYPVFTQQAMAVTFHQQWLQYLFCFLSMAAMMAAHRHPRRFWPLTILSLALMALELTITEYFIGLELLRPLLWWFLSGEEKRTIKHRTVWTAARSAPYIVLAVAYVIFRLFFIPLTGEDPYRADTLYAFMAAPLETLQKMAGIVWRDSLQMFATHWYETLRPELFPESMQPFQRISWLLAVAAMAGTLVYFLIMKADEPQPDGSNRSTVGQALLLGVLAAGLGALPAWITGRQVIFDYHSNRYAMPAMFGLSLATVTLNEWLSGRRVQRSAALALMIGLAVGFNLRLTNDFRWQQTEQSRFYWQLFWRMPALQPGTPILMEKDPFPNQGLFSTSAAVNLLYPQPPNHKGLAYWVYALGRRYTPNTLPDPLQLTLYTQFRTLIFEGASPGVLVYYNPQQAACLWVLGPEDKGDPAVPLLLNDALGLGDLKRILPGPVSTGYPDPVLFGAEPTRYWCAYYQKAALAAQLGDWQAVVDLGDQAAALGMDPEDVRSNSPHEWRPFLEGYARAGRWSEALEITYQSAAKDKRYGPWLCSIWREFGQEFPEVAGLDPAREDVFSKLQCSK